MPEFMTLVQWLTAPQETCGDLHPLAEEKIVEAPIVDDGVDDVDATLADALMFRATLEEAVELRAREIAREVAIEVLARELQLAPCDLAAVVKRARERYHLRDVVQIRVHPDDVTALGGNDAVVCDASLRRGDAMLLASCGSVDATLGVRLDRVLRAMG